MLENGYILLYRSLLKWEWYDDANTFRLFMHLLLTCNYEPKNWHGKTIERGQRITSYGILAKELKLSVRNVRTSLNHLISTHEVTIKATKQYSLVTIVNYDKFQVLSDSTTSETLTDCQSGDKRPTNDRQQRNKANKANKAKEDILLSGAIGIASEPEPAVISILLNDKSEYGISQKQIDHYSELYPNVDILSEMRKMKGWAESNPTRRKTKTGIARFITAWLSKEQDKGGTVKPSNQPPDRNSQEWLRQQKEAYGA